MNVNRNAIFLKKSLFRYSLLLGAITIGLLITSTLPAVYSQHPSQSVTLPASVSPQIASAQLTGHHASNDQINIGLVLKMSHQTEMQNLLTNLYNPHSSLYHHWLRTNEFESRFAPTSSQVTAAQNFLTQAGLQLASNSPSPSLLLATGTFSQAESAFHTVINNYTSRDGREFYANSTSVQLPAHLSGNVIGVLGLTNAASERPYDRLSKQKPNVPPPYGGGPFGRGLTPSQITGIYNADPVYKKLHDRGQGINLAVFELSGYTGKDIVKYENQFNLPNVPIVNKLVLGGATDHSGAGEVELDIELQIAMAPGANSLLVYQGPNTDLGVIAQYLQIARDNRADAISTSWGLCEDFVTSQIKLGEYQAFVQIAAQGQSIFAASGDSGAFDCVNIAVLPASQALQVDDPASQPFVTGVGGTTFQGTFDPGKNMHPSYPTLPAEHVWTDGCPPSSCTGGASGGGVSRSWGQPDYQNGPGVIEKNFSQSGTYCNQTPVLPCREVPDVSINGDPDSGYAIYCTDPGDKFCTDPGFSVKGWVRLGGTSTGSPLWAAIAALMDSFKHTRLGQFNYIVYHYDSTAGYSNQFHDITVGDNGHYPAGPGYDMSTGIGTPNIFKLVKP